RYEQLYGRGSSLAAAQLELVVARLRAKALTPQPKLVRAKKSSARIPKAAVRKKRDIYWPDLGKRRATPVYDGEALASGNKKAGRFPVPGVRQGVEGAGKGHGADRGRSGLFARSEEIGRAGQGSGRRQGSRRSCQGRAGRKEARAAARRAQRPARIHAGTEK